MTDTINLTEQLAGLNPASVFERTEENNPDQTDEVTRPGRGWRRGQLRAAFARERQRPRPAFLVELSQRARRTAETRETEAETEPDRAEEGTPRGRAALRQQFRQAMPGFREANQPEQAGGGGERRGVVTIPVGLERGTRQGGGAAAEPAAARTPERPGFQVGAQPTITTNREPPRLDSIRMAASFEQTALGNALNINRGPANLINQPVNPAANQGLAVGRNNPAERPGFDAGAAPTDQGRAGLNRPEQGPLARVQRRLENPGNNILNTDQRTPLAANRLAIAPGRIGNTQLEQRPLVERVTPGQADESDNALGGGIGTENVNRITGRANPPGNNQLVNPNTDLRFVNTPGQPPAPANAAPGQTTPDDRAGFGRGILAGRALVGTTQGPTPPQQAIPANRLAGAPVEALEGRVGENVRPAPAMTAGVAPPANPLEPETPDLLVNEPPALLDATTGPAVPRLADPQAAFEPEPPAANPAPPEPEPPETPAERAAAIRATPAEAADVELRATVPAPIEPPPGAATRETPAAPPGPAEANPAGTPGQVGRPVGAPETPQAPRAGFTAEAGEEEENGPGVNPPEAAPPGTAEGRPTRAGFTENPANEARPLAPRREETEEFERLQARAVAAYELQQMENRTNEPVEPRTVTELFIR